MYSLPKVQYSYWTQWPTSQRKLSQNMLLKEYGRSSFFFIKNNPVMDLQADLAILAANDVGVRLISSLNPPGPSTLLKLGHVISDFVIHLLTSFCFQCSTFNTSTAHSSMHSIHPSILYTRLIRRSGGRGVEPIPAVIGCEVRGTPWTCGQSITGPHRGKQPHSLLRTNLEITINVTGMFLDGGRKLEYRERTPHTRGEHADSTQKSPSR